MSLTAELLLLSIEDFDPMHSFLLEDFESLEYESFRGVNADTFDVKFEGVLNFSEVNNISKFFVSEGLSAAPVFACIFYVELIVA